MEWRYSKKLNIFTKGDLIRLFFYYKMVTKWAEGNITSAAA